MTISSAGRDPFYKKTSTYKSVIGVLRIQVPIVQHRKAVTWNINAMKEESIKILKWGAPNLLILKFSC